MDKSLTKIIKKKREKTQITNAWNKRGDITTKPTDNKRIIKDAMNNFMLTHLKTKMKSINFLKNTNY